MKSIVTAFLLSLFTVLLSPLSEGQTPSVVGEPGQMAEYSLSGLENPPASVVAKVLLGLGKVETVDGVSHQWIYLDATKVNGIRYQVWLLSAGMPSANIGEARSAIARYIVQEGDSQAVEYRDRFSGRAVLPMSGGWPHLIPRSSNDKVFPETARFLGHAYVREGLDKGDVPSPPTTVRMVSLLPEILVGVPINTRQRDETRRYDDSDYDYVPLTEDDYREMIGEGLNCFRVSPDKIDWFEQAGAFYYGVGGSDVPYPESLYRSQYLGLSLFLNEPGVVTRDQIVRARLREDADFRKAITPQIAMKAFEEHYEGVVRKGPPRGFINGLGACEDVDLGTMNFSQPSIHSWDTTVSSAAYQLSLDGESPGSFVSEPPGDVGTRRTLPEMNMAYGCQIPVNESNNLIDIVIGFLRGAARLTDKEWGVSIYGEVAPEDAGWYMTHAYNMGATRFFYWNNSRLASMPHGEIMALTHNLQTHAKRNPNRDLVRLREAGEVAILLPQGYTLGHVFMGRGPLWGLSELNLERKNQEGIPYRAVMGNFFTEIERCLRFGIAFDLMWDLPNIQPTGYREVVRVREDGKVEVTQGSKTTVLDRARTPERPGGDAPQLNVRLSASSGTAPLTVTASAQVVEGSAPVFYTYGPDSNGVEQNAMVAWELYGPNEEDCSYPRITGPARTHETEGRSVDTVLRLDAPGRYRLRAATVDLAGRTTVVWKDIEVKK